MSAFFGQIGSVLTTPPGNLIYELVLAFSIAAALQGSFLHWRSGGGVPDGRAVLGLGAMLGTLLLYFVLGAVIAGLLPAWRTILPPLDRAITFILLTCAVWIWAFPEPSRQPDLGTLIVVCLAIAFAGVELLTAASGGTEGGFNQTPANTLWQIAILLLLGAGGALLYIRRTEGFAIGLAFIALIFLGHAIHLITREVGDYSGVVRLAHIAAFPLLLTLSQRARAAGGEPVPAAEAQDTRGAEARRYGADPKTIHALLSLVSETDRSKSSQVLARAVAHTMLSDLCFVVFPTEDQSQLDIAGGYDLIREDYLQGARVDASMLPRLVSAIQRGRPLRLSAGGTAEDAKGLGDLLGLKDPGNLLCASILTPENKVLGAFLLLSPYSHRAWTGEDQNLLGSIASAVVPWIERAGEDGAARSDEDTTEALRIKEEVVMRLQQRNDDLSQQLETIALEAEKSAAEIAAVESFRAEAEQARKRIQELETELEAARAAPVPADAHLEEQLKATLGDVARLQNQLAESNQKMLELGASAGGERRKKEQAEVIASISQELRQPMSSIIGYTDLLLGESVGILGALQRKFIERIKASTERIGGLIDDLIQLTTLEVGLSELKPEAMDLNLIIDNALAYTSSQVREKKIAIHLDLPKNLAPVNADREALQQILIHLLQNAGAATPMEGTIGLKVMTTVDEGKSYVMLQVTDSGGGIPEEDLPRVFTRLFRADNVLIQGVGDTGVGLSIAKTLTEAQHGRIWVESQPGAGATFSVLLPAVGDTVGRMPGKEIR